MKKKIFIIAAFFGLGLGMTSCSDMLDTDSDRQIFDPALDEKTDSMFYTLGILRGVQQATDQYVLVNEMRGDLTATNVYTSEDLRELANFSADATNKYDSAYVYYRIINECNYFVAHRDTTLLTGSRKVSIPEYVQAKAIRAWAYLQLAKTYGSVPFYTDPITNISDANNVPAYQDLNSICSQLIADLKPWSGTGVPTYGTITAGQMNNGTTKTVASSTMMFPVDLVLGDLYLETGDYENAARSYYTYLYSQRNATLSRAVARNYSAPLMNYPNFRDLPSGIHDTGGDTWTLIFSSSTGDMITYVPFAVNRLRGTVTDLPGLFGFDYYSTEATNGGTYAMYKVDNEIDPSATYAALNNSQEYFWTTTGSNRQTIVNSAHIGDMRQWGTFYTGQKDDSTLTVMRKFNQGNVPIYRCAVVYLRLAEAMNRMGYPDAAFAVLKDGIDRDLLNDTLYVRDTTFTMLRTVLPFLSSDNLTTFESSYGIHSYGCGYTEGMNNRDYTYQKKVWEKVNATRQQLGMEPITESIDSLLPSMDEQIDAVEDLICDEYALEAAFEGHRFADLTRMAAHKNLSSPWGANYGSQWLARKLAYKHPVVDLTDPSNWYLPFRH